MDFLIQLILMIQIVLCWIVSLPFYSIKTIAHKMGKYYCTHYLKYVSCVIGILLIVALCLAQLEVSGHSGISSGGILFIVAVRTRDQLLFSFTMLVVLYRIALLLSESYKLHLNCTALQMQSKGQGAFFKSLLDDNKKLEEKTKHLDSKKEKKNTSSSDQDEEEVRSQRKQECTKEETLSNAEQPTNTKKTQTDISKDEVADNSEDKSPNNHKNKATDNHEDKTTDKHNDKAISNQVEEGGMKIVLEEMRKKIGIDNERCSGTRETASRGGQSFKRENRGL